MSTNKCEHFNKGYCKNKNKCSLKHPLAECAGDCEDKRVCPKRHQIPCKNGQECAFFATESCEFLHHSLLHMIVKFESIPQGYNLLKGIYTRQN